MIIASENGQFLFITQTDHARFAAELLSLWRKDGLPEHPRRAELLFAVREHDNGWREADAAPRWDREHSRPHEFLSIPKEDRIEIWQRGTTRFAREHPYAALLITRHATQIHRERRGEEWQPFQEFLTELAQELMPSAGVTEDELEADYRWLDLVDLLSLAVCNRWSGPFGRYGVQGLVREGTLHLDPFPLAGATGFAIPCRRIPRRIYLGDADLGGELAAARWDELRIRVAAAY